MKRLVGLIEKWSFPAFLIGLLFFRLPPFYLVPFIRSAFLTSHSMSRVIFVSLVMGLVLLLAYGKEKSFAKRIEKSRGVIVLIFLWFLALSLGIIYTENLLEFLMRYKEVFGSVLLFFLGLKYGDKLKTIMKVVIIAFVISVVYQAIIFLYPVLFRNIISMLFYDKHAGLVSDNTFRGRIYIETYDEAMLPLMLWWIGNGMRKNVTWLQAVLIVVTGFFSFVSNFRSRLAMFIVSVVGYGLSKLKSLGEWKGKLKPFLIMGGLLVLTVVVTDTVGRETVGFGFLDRVAFTDKREDIDSLVFRGEQMITSLELAQKNDFFGVGLGNYYQHLPFAMYSYRYSISGVRSNFKSAAEYVHSIVGTFFTEGGIWSGVLFLGLLYKFGKDDLKVIQYKRERGKMAVVAFWSLFLYTLLNPFVPFVLQGLFWFLRGILAYEVQSKA